MPCSHCSTYMVCPPRPRLAGPARSSTTMMVAIGSPALRHDALVKLGVVPCHPPDREALLGPGAYATAVQSEACLYLLRELHRVRRRVTRAAFVHDFGHCPT